MYVSSNKNLVRSLQSVSHKHSNFKSGFFRKCITGVLA